MTGPVEIMVMSGPYDGSTLQAAAPHDPAVGYILGRHDGCDFSFPYDRWVSTRHARLFQIDAVWYIEDLVSRNKTYVGKQRPDGTFAGRDPIEKAHPVAARQLIQLGRLWIRIQGA